jgi:hypothetical protein
MTIFEKIVAVDRSRNVAFTAVERLTDKAQMREFMEGYIKWLATNPRIENAKAVAEAGSITWESLSDGQREVLAEKFAHERADMVRDALLDNDEGFPLTAARCIGQSIVDAFCDWREQRIDAMNAETK